MLEMLELRAMAGDRVRVVFVIKTAVKRNALELEVDPEYPTTGPDVGFDPRVLGVQQGSVDVEQHQRFRKRRGHQVRSGDSNVLIRGCRSIGRLIGLSEHLPNGP